MIQWFISKKRQASKIATRTSFANMVLLVLVLVLFVAIAILFASSISSNASRNLALSYSIEAAEKFHLFIVRDLVLVQKAARSSALTNWFTNEDNSAAKTAAFHEIMDYIKVFDTAHLYFGIDNSLDEYSITDGTTFEQFVPFDRLSPSHPFDIWYFDCINAASDYVLKIGTDKDTQDKWQLWIHHKVMTDQDVLGAFGSGLPIQTIIDQMFAHHDDKDLLGYVVDKNGHILMDNIYAGLYGEENRMHIHDVDDDPALVKALGEYLRDIDGHFDDHSGSGSMAKVVKLTRGVYEHAAIAPITHSDWSVVIFYNNRLLNGATDIVNLLPLMFFMLLALLLYVVGGNILMRKLIFTPLSRLTKSVSESKIEQQDIFGSDRDDEIGELARTIQIARNTLGEYIVTLRETTEEQRRLEDFLNTVNHTAGILLRSETGDFDADLHRCMGMIAEMAAADRVYIYRNNTVDGKIYCNKVKEWTGSADPYGGKGLTFFSYAESSSGWKDQLSQGKCINSLVRDLSIHEQAHLIPLGILSIFVMPVFVQDQFWGFVGYDNRRSERVFSESEQAILRSGGIIMVNAMLRQEMMMHLQSTAIELESALARARDASRAKSSFLANTSHEMRTPLNAIIGLSELTLETGRISDDAHENLEKIYNAGTTLLSTVNDILDISRIEADKLELVAVEYETSSLINDTITQSIMRIGGKPIEFILNIDENLPARLYGDDLRVKQMISNLLSNAFKYTREGEVELALRCTPYSASSQTKEGNVWVEVDVRDTGIGIRKEDIEALFVEYTKMDTGANRTIEGTGLGLPITRKLAEFMGGSLSVESEYGRGSVFSIRFLQKLVGDTVIGENTVSNLKNFRHMENRREQSARLGRIRIPYARVLVVDDVVTNLDVAKGLLQLYGMQVDCVLSGQEAVDAIKSEDVRYDAIFMDHMMPKMDGIETTENIRKIGTDYAQKIPVIALTANAIVGTEEMFLSKGFQAFISKPIQMERLDAVIREWVQDEEQDKLLLEKNNAGKDKRPYTGTRSGQDRRSFSDRREGIDRRTFGKDISGLDMGRGINRFESEETYLKILQTYASNTLSLLDIIREVNTANLADYAVTVHGIKGSSRGVYATVVGNKAEELEKAAKAGDLDFVKTNNPSFLGMVEKLVADIEEAIEQANKINGKQKKDRVDRKLLSMLLAGCNEYDIDKIDAAMEEIESWEYTEESRLPQYLRENVDRMNYSRIAEIVLEIQHE